jgi:hypothetical protein
MDMFRHGHEQFFNSFHIRWFGSIEIVEKSDGKALEATLEM